MSEALKNEIHAYFGVQNSTTTAPIKQWAYGQKLIIHDPKLPNVFEAYYSNSKSIGDAKPQIGQDGEVRAPHEYFESGADIYVFLMQHEEETDGRYNKVVHIPITPAPKPVDIDPDPEESLVIGELVDAMNNTIEQSETNVTHYPCIINGYWHVWDAQTEAFVSTGVAAQGEQGDGGLAIFFSVPNKAIPTDANRKIVEDQSINFGVYAFKGGELIDPENVTASAFTFQSGQYSGAINAVVTHSTSERPQWHVSYTLRTSANITLRADSGTQTVNVTVDGVVHKIYFPWSAAKQGVQGEGGLSILIGQSGVLFPTNAEKTFTANYDTGAIPIRAVKGTEFIDIDSVDAISSIEFTRNGTLRIVSPTIGFNPSDHTRYTVSHQFLAGDIFSDESGVIKVRTTIDGVAYDRTIPWTLSKQGIQGDNGDKGDPGDDYILTASDKQEIAAEVSDMFVVEVTGRTPTITAQANTRYVCGELDTLDFTPSATGICDIIFTSGSTATVLTLPNTVKMPSGFSVAADTVYELNFLAGLGVYQTWSTS